MKKKVLYLFAIMISSIGHSQIREKGAIELTPIVGYSSATQIHSLLGETKSVNGIQFGLYAKYFFNNRWSIRTGLLHQKMGVERISYKLLIFEDQKYAEQSHYLTVPLAVNYHFGSTRKWYVNYGASFGALLDVELNSYDGNGYVDVKNTANSTQFGVTGGIGYKLEVTPKLSILIDYSGMLGLSDVHKDRGSKNFYNSFNLGAVFKL